MLINKRKVQAVAVQRKEDLLKDFVTDYKINGKKAVKKAERYTTLLLREFKGMMVQRYAHHHTESLRAAIEKIDEIKKPIITILSQSA